MKRMSAKEILAESFRELAAKTSVDKITIQDIIENCGYSKTTFYRLFKDKYDLMAWDYTRRQRLIMDQTEEAQYEWKQTLTEGAVFLNDQRAYLKNLLLHTNGYDSFSRNMKQIHFESLRKCVLDASGEEELDTKTQMYVRTYCQGTVDLICDWIMDVYDASPEVLAEVFENCLPFPLRDLLLYLTLWENTSHSDTICPVRRSSTMCSEAEMAEAFLALRSFEDYMARLEEFIGLSVRKDIFKKDLDLMETDALHTHRQKEQIRQKRKREITKRLQTDIKTLCDEVIQSGPYVLSEVSNEGSINIAYLYPDGKRGDINHALVMEKADSIEKDGDICYAVFPSAAYKDIDRMLFPVRSLFSGYDFSRLKGDAAASYLIRFSRILQIEYLMWEINYLIPNTYRSLRSVPDKGLREILQRHHNAVEDARNKIYEKLIEADNTHAKWISEQKAFAIVKRHYPDAVFQHRPDWLQGQWLDIYIPSKNVGIEYQGRQHSEAVEFFGGEEGLKKNIGRDTRKKYRCRTNGVKLIYWNYDQPVTEEFFNETIVTQIED